MLRRRHHPQEKTAGKTKGRQKAHETGGECGDSAISVFGDFGDWGEVGVLFAFQMIFLFVKYLHI